MSTEPVVIQAPPAILRKHSHPEWITLALNGVAPEQIAPRVYYTAQEVRAYIGSFRRRHPEVWARRLFLHDQPQPRPANFVDKDRFWRRQLHEVMAFQLRHGRRPVHASDDGHEMRLGQWITAQRSDEKVGKLPGHRRRWMDENVAEWRIPDRDVAGAQRWRERLDQVRDHRAKTGQWPRVRRGHEAEKKLRVWLQGQRNQARKGRLSQKRTATLDEQLPGWRG